MPKIKKNILSKVTNDDLDKVTLLLDKEVARLTNMKADEIMEHWDLISWRNELTSVKKVFYFLVQDKNRKSILDA